MDLNIISPSIIEIFVLIEGIAVPALWHYVDVFGCVWVEIWKKWRRHLRNRGEWGISMCWHSGARSLPYWIAGPCEQERGIRPTRKLSLLWSGRYVSRALRCMAILMGCKESFGWSRKQNKKSGVRSKWTTNYHTVADITSRYHVSSCLGLT